MLPGFPTQQFAEAPSLWEALKPALISGLLVSSGVGLWIIYQMRAYGRRLWATNVAAAVRAKDLQALEELSQSRDLAGWVPAFEDVLVELRETLEREEVRAVKAEARADELARRFDQCPVPELTLDPDRRILSANDEACWLLGRLRSDLIGLGFPEVVRALELPDTDTKRFDWVHGLFAARDASSEVFEATRSDSTEARVLALARPVRSTCGRPLEAVTLLDITQLPPHAEERTRRGR